MLGCQRNVEDTVREITADMRRLLKDGLCLRKDVRVRHKTSWHRHCDNDTVEWVLKVKLGVEVFFGLGSFCKSDIVDREWNGNLVEPYFQHSGNSYDPNLNPTDYSEGDELDSYEWENEVEDERRARGVLLSDDDLPEPDCEPHGEPESA